MYLVDTNVLSDLTAPIPRPALVDWLDRHSLELYLSAITAAEVAAGIAKLRRLGSASKADRLSDWWGAIEHLYGPRILPFGIQEARKAGDFMDLARAAGQAPGFADIAIAAAAAVKNLTVLTRNTKHFSFFPLKLIDPFLELPD